jgi:hypothetical protein
MLPPFSCIFKLFPAFSILIYHKIASEISLYICYNQQQSIVHFVQLIF